MAELKTKRTTASVEDFLDAVEPEQKRQDAFTLLSIFKEATGLGPAMWGPSIVGFGQYHYKSERSTQEGDWPLVAFSPRKQNLTLYVLNGPDAYSDLRGRLGKHRTSVSCLYINKLSDVDLDVLKQLVHTAFVDNEKRLT